MATTETRSLRERKKQARKERIYQAAVELFRQQGFDGTTVEEIAAAADVGKGTFFNYFPTKEAVLLYQGERQMMHVRDQLADVLASPTLSAVAKLKCLLHTLTEGLEDNKDLTRVVVFETIKTPAALSDRRDRLGFRTLVSEILAAGQARGEIRPDLDSVLMAQAIVAVYLQEVFFWCTSQETYALVPRLSEMLDMFVEGIGARHN